MKVFSLIFKIILYLMWFTCIVTFVGSIVLMALSFFIDKISVQWPQAIFICILSGLGMFALFQEACRIK